MAKTLPVMKGKALWAKVFTPDTKFDSDGIYSIDVVIPEEDAQEVCEYLEGLRDERLAEEVKANPKAKSLSARPVYELDLDQDGNETGNYKFKVKLKATVRGRDNQTYTQRPIVVDSKRSPMTEETLIGNGSIVKVAYEPHPYVMASNKQVGVSLRLKGVQVLQLVEYGNKGAASMFDEEDGYVAEPESAADTSEISFDDGQADGEAEGDF
jgi:hypothetical protein